MLQCFKLTFEFELNTLYLNHTAEMKTHTHEKGGGGGGWSSMQWLSLTGVQTKVQETD